MPKYTVLITETKTTEIVVEAKDDMDAEIKASRYWHQHPDDDHNPDGVKVISSDEEPSISTESIGVKGEAKHPTLNCEDGQLPDGPVCPSCHGPRAPSGIGGGTWVHFPSNGI